MVRAGLHNPEALIMAATDALYATEPLRGLETYEDKRLGKWEHKPAEDVGEAAVFHSSGVYNFMEFKRVLSDAEYERYYDLRVRKANGELLVDEDASWLEDQLKATTKTRGFRSDSPGEIRSNRMRTGWRKGAETISEDVMLYVTPGMATASEEQFKFRSCWADTQREMDLDCAGTKRKPLRDKTRGDQLVKTEPVENWSKALSAPYVPEWVDTEFGDMREDADEQEEIMIGHCESDEVIEV